jgi:hypothetical protein
LVIVIEHDRPSQNPAQPVHGIRRSRFTFHEIRLRRFTRSGAAGSRSRNRTAKPAFTITITAA